MEDGIKTFPFPVQTNDKIKLIEAEFGIRGFAVVWKLHQAIYQHGYYLKWDIDTQLLFISDYRLSQVGRSSLSEIVEACLRRGVFDSDLFNTHTILTSERIQETFLTAKSRSTKVIMDKRYALPIVYDFIENARKKEKNVNIFWKNADILEQKKGREKKGKEIPPTPQEGEVWGEEKERFLNAYPKLKAGKNYDDRNIDYKVLYERFARSAHLRDTYSMKWVCNNYELIAQGVFDDEEKNKPYQDESSLTADVRGERERYYAARREQALDRAEKVRKRAIANEEFRQADGELKACEIAVARAEVSKSEKLPFLLSKLEEIKGRRRNALQAINIQESDLLPNYTCKKCSDTGFTKDGRMCDCYKKN